MIYNKEASFSYPVFAENINAYANPIFNFDVTNLTATDDEYIFTIEYNINSDFLNELIELRKASLVFIINTSDNFFVKLEPGQKSIRVSNKRLSFNSRATIQLQIQAETQIEFNEADGLNEFYKIFKENISVDRYSLLGFTQRVTYTNPDKFPIDLFRYKVEAEMSHDFEIELTPNDIVLKVRINRYLFPNIVNRNSMLNMYIYVGLSRALNQFIRNNIQLTDREEEAEIWLDTLSSTNSILDDKLLELMKDHGVEYISYDNIDEIIHLTSDKIVDKFVKNIELVNKYEN